MNFFYELRMFSVSNVSNDSRVSDELLNEIIRNLNDRDDLNRVKLLTDGININNFESVMSLRELSSNVGNRREFWVELLFLIQRCDLLRLLDVSKENAYEQTKEKTFFQDRRKVLLKIFENIAQSREEEFCTKALFVRNVRNTSGRTCLVDTLLKFGTSLDFEILKGVLTQLHLESAVDEIELYLTVHPVREVDHYEMDTNPCGKCVIINNEYVSRASRREGCNIDKVALERVFRGFSFDVDVYDNVTLTDMNGILNHYATLDHSSYSAFICCIMTHGEKDFVYTSDRQKMSIQKIVLKFCGTNCETLVAKPKIFIFQACQGENYQEVLRMQPPSNVQTDGPSPNRSDCLIGIASVGGSVAFRERETGSWFIQAIVSELESDPDMSEVQRKVSNALSKKIGEIDGDSVSQTPIWQSTLTRKLIFRRR